MPSKKMTIVMRAEIWVGVNVDEADVAALETEAGDEHSMNIYSDSFGERFPVVLERIRHEIDRCGDKAVVTSRIIGIHRTPREEKT